MAEEFILDFTGVESVKGAGSQGDRVPEGRYRVVITKWLQQDSQAGNPMHIPWFEIEGGEQDGKRLMDRFVVLPGVPPDKNFGLRRLKGFMECLGYHPEKKIKIDPKKVFINKRIMVYVEDEAIVINDVDTGRIRSAIKGYDAIEETAPTNGVVAQAPAKAAVVEQTAPAQAAAPAAVVEPEVAEPAEPAEAIEPARDAPASVDDEVESLFS